MSNSHDCHARHHEPYHTDDLSHDDRNLAHWDKVAKTYTSDHTQKGFGDLINKATEFVLANISSIGIDFLDPAAVFESGDAATPPSPPKPVRILDYACGPGTVTNILTGRATEFVGIDLSPNMVEQYNKRFSSPINTDNSNDREGEKINAQAYNANLLSPSGVPESLDDEKFFNFDLVAVGFGFHHFENLPLTTRRLVDRLKPGGVLMILDFFSHDRDMGHDPAMNTIAHHGFTEEQVKELFAGAGLEDNLVLDFGYDVIMKKHAKRRPFMARGRKPALHDSKT